MRVLGYVLLFVMVPTLAFSQVLAKVGKHVVYAHDVEIALAAKGRKNPTDKEKQEMLKALVARFLLEEQAKKEGLDKDKDVLHRIELCKASILASRFVRDHFAPDKIKVSKKEVEEFYEKKKDLINPRARMVIITSVIMPNGAKKLAQELLERISKVNDPEEINNIISEYRTKKGLLAKNLYVTPEQKIFSNQRYFNGAKVDFTKKCFETPVGKAFLFKVDPEYYKIVYIKEDLGRTRFGKEDALKITERILKNEKARDSLEAYVKKLEKEQGVQYLTGK